MVVRLATTFLGLSLGQAVLGQSLPALNSPVLPSVFSRHGITTWVSTDSGYPAMLDTALGKALVAELGPLVPFSAVIRNDGSVAIAGILLRATMIDGAGKQSWGTSRLQFSRTPLPPGGAVVITPDGGTSQVLYLRMQGRVLPPGPPLSTLVSQFVTGRFTSQGIQTVTLALDSIVLANGAVIGPDVFDVVGESQARNGAIVDILAKMSDPSLTDSQLAEWLNSQILESQKQPAYRGGGLFDHAVMQRLSVLQITLTELKSLDRGRTETGLKSGLTSLFRLDQ